MAYLKTEGTDAKLWVIGDSFTGINFELESWPCVLYNSFNGKHIHSSSDGSRDIQTVIDIFLKNLHKIKPNDFVILMLPTTARFRLPLINLSYDMEIGNQNEHHYKNMFIGNRRYVGCKQSYEQELSCHGNIRDIEIEYPLSKIATKLFDIEYKRWNTIDIPAFSPVITAINSSNASIMNYNQILNSFLLHFPFKIKLYSWANELDNSIIDTKDIITEKCKDWETLNDQYLKTNGKDGVQGDAHWSKKMNKLFAELIIKENPNYFNQNL